MSSPHVRSDKMEKIGITVTMDYCFMNGKEDEDPSLPGVLIVWDDNYECLCALPVEREGPVDWVVKCIVDKLEIKSDQEPAMLASKTAAAAKRSGLTTPWTRQCGSPSATGRWNRQSVDGRDNFEHRKATTRTTWARSCRWHTH